MKTWLLIVGLAFAVACGGKQRAPAEPPYDWKPNADEGVNMQWSKISQPGRTTPWNEDVILVDQERRILVVADGMGANGAAAEMVVEAIEAREDGDFVAAIREVNTTIHEAAQSDPAKRGMGASVVAVGITPQKAYVAHVGDTRLYRFRDGKVEAVTTDHILANESLPGIPADMAAKMPKTARTRVVGTRPEVDVELEVVDVQRGDRLLLCSQGVHKVVSNDELAEILGSDATPDEKSKAINEVVLGASAPYDASLILLEL